MIVLYLLLLAYLIVAACAWHACYNQKAPFWITAGVAFGWPLWVVLAAVGAFFGRDRDV